MLFKDPLRTLEEPKEALKHQTLTFIEPFGTLAGLLYKPHQTLLSFPLSETPIGLLSRVPFRVPLRARFKGSLQGSFKGSFQGFL